MDTINIVRNIAFDTLANHPAAVKVCEDLECLYKYQQALCVMANDPENADINILRAGTVMAAAVCVKIFNGKKPRDFDGNDWKEIADKVRDKGILEEPRKYTEFIFQTFATYIDFSVKANEDSLSESSVQEVRALAYELNDLSIRFRNDQLTEPDYVDRCLWISFEAMIKLLAGFGFCATKRKDGKEIATEFQNLKEAIVDLSIQYGRYKLYEHELNLLNGYIENQKILDDKLNDQYDRYITDLQKESAEFNDLLETAFCDDFRDRLRNSVTLARKTGVDEDRILDSRQKIDSFFIE